MGSKSSSPTSVSSRSGVFPGPNNTDNDGDKDRASGNPCPASDESDPYNDPHTRSQQDMVKAILDEIPSGRSERITLQERMDLYRAMKESYQDGEKALNERLGIHLSEGFTDSQVDTTDSESGVGHDIEDILTSVNRESTEETEMSQVSLPRTTRPDHVFNYLSSRPSTESQYGTKGTSDSASDVSSDFEEDPKPASEFHPRDSKQDASSQQASPQNQQEIRTTPLMGFFGAGSTARGRTATRGLGFPTRSRGISRRGGQPKCFGCEARHAE